jgi:hypothetical protein
MKRNRQVRRLKPRFKNTTSPITNVKFTETLIPSVVGGVTAAQDLFILPTNFPWLATTATVFSKYQLRKVVITFIPAGSTTYTGQIVGAFTYDSFEAPPSTFSQVSQTAAHRIQTIHRRQSWSLDVTKTTNRIYPTVSNVAFLTIPASGRVPYLPAFFHLVNNSPNTQMLGSLQVTYSVDFTAPLFLSTLVPSFNMLGTNLIPVDQVPPQLDLLPDPLTSFESADITHPTPQLLQ